MAVSDLDPVFVRSLKLLQSRSRESTEQLRQIYEELLEQRKLELSLRKDGEDSEESRSSGSSSSRVSKRDESKRQESDKDIIDKCKQELTDLNSEPPPAKKQKSDTGAPVSKVTEVKARVTGEKGEGKARERLREIEEDIFFAPQTQSSSLSRTKEQRERQERGERERMEKSTSERERVRQQKERESVVMEKNDSSVTLTSDSDTEVSDDGREVGGAFTKEAGLSEEKEEFELDLISLSCTVCNTMNQTATNQLLECQDCHMLCHQECHKPPVTDNVTDPRFIWYCATCSKNLKKIGTKPIVKKSVKTTSVPGTVKETVSVNKSARPDPVTVVQPFKRLDTTKPVIARETAAPVNPSTTGTGGRVLSGLASLAANFKSAEPVQSKSTGKSEPGGAGSSRAGPKVPDVSKYLAAKAAATPGSPFKPLTLSKGDATVGGAKVSPPVIATNRSSPASGGSGVASTPTNKTIAASSSSSSSVVNSKSAAVVGSSSGSASVSGSANSSASGSGKVPQSTLASADKRLQMMKKKAAAKRIEKRSK